MAPKPPQSSPPSPPTVTWGGRAQLLRGKLRRFFLGHFRKDYVARSLAKRGGDCQRCGACCHLLFRCPWLDQRNGQGVCTIYDSRPLNCRIFPMNNQDLADRDLVMPEHPCGFNFKAPSDR